jgi:predicted RecA/RadA family phage recombinase
MQNFIQPGNVITFTAPSGGILAGQGVLAGALFGVAATTAAVGQPVECSVTGVFELPKAADNIGFGDRLYWDGTAKALTTGAEGNTLVGVAVAPAGVGAATVRARLNGIA